MSNVWIPSEEEFNEMCKRCGSSGSNALKLFKSWLDHTRRYRPVCKETFCPADSKNGQAPLVLAANSGNAHIVRYLLTECSGVIDVDYKGDIARHSRGKYRTSAISHKLHIPGGVTALWAACCWGNREIAQLLLRAGADVTGATTNTTPMEIAAYNGHCEIMELLYSYGADVNMRNGQDCSPLMAAAATNHINVVIFLLEHGADVSQKNTKGYSVFHVATTNGNLEIIHVLKRKGFSSSNFTLPLSGVIPCPYFIAMAFGYDDIVEELKQLHVLTKAYESETCLLMGARYVMLRQQQIPMHRVLGSWRNAVRLRDACGYVPNFLPPSDVYAGLKEIVVEKDLAGPPKEIKLDMETWVRYQSLLIIERIVGPPFLLRGLLNSGSVLCDKKMFRSAELLWLRSIEYYSTYNTDIFVGNEVPNVKASMHEFALGIHKMVLLQYRPDFSKFVQFGFRILSNVTDVVTVELILWMFVSWIRSDCREEECYYYSDKCEEFGKKLVSMLLRINKKKTLLQLAVSNFKLHHLSAHILFGSYYQHLILALLRWGCSQDIYSIMGHSHLIHEAVKVSNEGHIDIVTPLLKYGASPLFVDSKGRTAFQLATNDVMLCAMRPHCLSLFSMCCVAIVKYGLPYESLELPSAVKNYIQLFDKNSRFGV